ncbi:hypothetical protein DQ04_07281040, partial [Trypanosoma grayi]|uniref:hypothetical protein n=1 Tax=Trypanosoma grayi TaxID=71804 RepID=UPI0004F49A6D
RECMHTAGPSRAPVARPPKTGFTREHGCQLRHRIQHVGYHRYTNNVFLAEAQQENNKTHSTTISDQVYPSVITAVSPTAAGQATEESQGDALSIESGTRLVCTCACFTEFH